MLDLCDYLAYCLDDEATHAVVLFVEGFKRPELFLALADHALEIGKPILAVKVGSSPQAQASAVAHSGSLAGEDRIVDAALRASGVIRCADLDELLEAAELVAGTRRLGRSVGRGRTGVVTVSTGEASLIADLAPRTGVDLPPIPEATRARIHADLPTLGYIGNPMDPWGADDTRGRLRSVPARLRRFGRLRRRRGGARLPVPLAGRRGRAGDGARGRAGQGHGRPAGRPARVRVAHLG